MKPLRSHLGFGKVVHIDVKEGGAYIRLLEPVDGRLTYLTPCVPIPTETLMRGTHGAWTWEGSEVTIEAISHEVRIYFKDQFWVKMDPLSWQNLTMDAVRAIPE